VAKLRTTKCDVPGLFKALKAMGLKADTASRANSKLSDYIYNERGGDCIYIPNRKLYPCSSVNKILQWIVISEDETRSPVDHLAKTRSAKDMTWSPGHPMEIKDQLIMGTGWVEEVGVMTFNTYKEPKNIPGDPAKAGMWINHFKRIYPDTCDSMILDLAMKVQHPEIKINHFQVWIGNQGIGKDTLLVPIRYAVGCWNFQEVSPSDIMDNFNPHIKSVILRISEARDEGEGARFDRFKFYDRMKTLTVTPPETLSCNEKNVKPYDVVNVTFPIITTNYETESIHLSPDDRRALVAASVSKKEEFTEESWNKFYRWYETDDGSGTGIGHVVAYLKTLDLSGFNPKAPPPKTAAWHAIVDASRSQSESEFDDALDALGRPDAVTIFQLKGAATMSLTKWLKEPKNARHIAGRLKECGYVTVRNPDSKKGLWRVNEKVVVQSGQKEDDASVPLYSLAAGTRRQMVYAKEELSVRDRINAVAALFVQEPKPEAEQVDE
jgi:Family of unknown function (DUF5906)